MMRLTKIGSSFALALALAACGSPPAPKELLDARAAYTKAQAGPTNQTNPAQVHVAKEALDSAERAFADDPTAQETKDKAYVALRVAELADAQGRLAIAEKEKSAAQKELQDTQVSQLSSTKKQLTSMKLTLEQEKQARIDAEKRAKEALENLAKMAQIKEESRGMVITLSGAVLFTSGHATLLPAALSGLDNVVTALKSTPDRNVIVEGHTDSQGARSFNMDLATKRAQSVRDYIVSRGLPAETVKAVGIGPDRPIGENNTAEGRANNRRVEIIVSPAERK
jgi:outer membrane protein OmpA-like peptidoglycan-associated protein